MDSLQIFWKTILGGSPELLRYSVSVISAILILIAGWIVARWVRGRMRKPNFGGSRMDATLRPIIAMTLYAVLTKIGVPATSLLAVFGAAGLAVGLALKDTLSNIAAGLMILFLRPLAIDEYIDTPGFAGTVKEVGVFATTLINSEGVFIYIPNRLVWNGRLMNYGRHNTRRFICDIRIGYETDLRKAQTLLTEVMIGFSDIIMEPSEPEVYVMDFGESAVILSCRCYLPGHDWLALSSDLRIALKAGLDKAEIDIAYPQQVIRHKGDRI